MKNILVFIISISYLFCFPQNKSETYDFKKSNWGDYKYQVKKAEKLRSVSENDNYIEYNSQISGIACTLTYIFTQGKLSAVKYRVSVEHENNNHYLIDRDKLEDLLSRKYGKPTNYYENWISPVYEDDPSAYGYAISIGHYSIYTQWKNQNTDIVLTLEGSGNIIDLTIKYISKKYKELDKSAEDL